MAASSGDCALSEAPAPWRARRIYRLVIQLVGPVLLVFVLLHLQDVGAVLDALSWSDGVPLMAAMLLNALNYYFKVLRWDVLLAARGYSYSRLRAWTSFLSSGYVGLLTPGRVGDLLRTQYLRHDLGMPYAEGIALLAIDRLCDLYVLLAFAGVGIAFFGPALTGDLAVVTWAGVSVMALGPLLLFVPGLTRWFAAFIYRKMPGEPDFAGFDRFLAGLKHQRLHHIVRAVFWTVLAFCINYMQGYLLAGALDLHLGVFDVVCLLAVASLLGLLPISVSGLGVRELFFSLAFPLLGYSAEVGVIYGLGVFLVIYVATVIMGFISWQVAPPPIAPDQAPAAAPSHPPV